MTSQDKFFQVLGIKAEEAELELVVDYRFSNVGTIHLQDGENVFDTWLSIPFDFQHGRASFGWLGAQGEDVFERPNPRFALFEPHQLGEAIEQILAHACMKRRQAEVPS